MENLENISKRNIEKAFEIIAELEIQKTWENLNSTCNLVGSVKTGLLMNKLDIDFHTYSNDFSIEKSFSAIAQISRNPKIKKVTYRNLLDAYDMCLEWHLWYEETQERIWTIDIIHIKNESAYAGVIERVTEKIKSVLTEKQRQIILKIKWESEQRSEKYSGIDIYQAVIDEGIANFEDFKTWNKKKKTLQFRCGNRVWIYRKVACSPKLLIPYLPNIPTKPHSGRVFYCLSLMTLPATRTLSA